MLQIIIFFIASLVNVILSTTKTIWTVNGTKFQAVMINILTYSIYTLVLKQITSTTLLIAVVVTALTNLIGVWIARLFIDKISKDRLWKIEVIAPKTQEKEITNLLQNAEIGYNISSVCTKFGNEIEIKIFSKNQKDSTKVKEILHNRPIKYNITELTKTL